MNFGLVFPLPARLGPIFTIPGDGAPRRRAHPAGHPAWHDPAFLGDVEAAGGLLVSVQRVDTLARQDGFTVEVNLQVLNASGSPRA